MASIARFEDIVGWQKARILTREIYLVSKRGDFARDFGLSGQIQRAAVSVMSNLAEGFERQHLTERIQFVAIAKASCAEVRSQLYVALDVGYLNQSEFDDLQDKAEEIAKILSKLKSALEEKGGKVRDEGLGLRDESLSQRLLLIPQT